MNGTSLASASFRARWLVVALSVLTLAAFGLPASATENVEVERLGGASRYETAVRISQEYPESYDVWLARGDAFPDALAASYPAGFYSGRASLLLTTSERLHDATRQELERLNPSRVWIMGSEVAISDDVVAEVRALGIDDINRVSGRDRYETAAAAASVAPENIGTAFVATGTDFADALVAGPLAFSLLMPILLTPPDSLHPATAEALNDGRIQEVIILGGTGAVSERVAEQISQICSGGQCIRVRRIGGATRTETATLLANEFMDQYGVAPTHVNLARGDAFPDAAAGGPHGGHEQAPILLTANPTTLSDATRAWLETHSNTIDSIHAFGTQNALSDQVLEEARQAATTP